MRSLLPQLGQSLFDLIERIWVGTSWLAGLLRLALLALGAGLFWLAVTVPLEGKSQVLFASCCLVMALVVRRRQARPALIMLVTLSLIASSRYLYWRLTETLSVDSPLDQFFGAGLVLAELYAFVVLVLGFIQTVWPLQRKPVLMPPDRSDWPSIDIFIPTYNEALAIVKPTIFAAQGLDWPADKLRIYVLDDGRRAEFGDFVPLLALPT
jgi:cellulose synthase (UDP-forming)